jgi:tetratricopeptide (TPR) repeat protein
MGGGPPESHENIMSRPGGPPAEAPPPPPQSRKPPGSSRTPPKVDTQRGAELESELQIFEKKIKDEVNAFELLDLELDAGRKEIRGRWGELSKRMHPDTLEAYGLAYLRPRMESVFAAISEAYGVLSNKDDRERLLAMIRAGGSGKAGEDANALVKNALQADMLARDGEKALRAGRYDAALEAFRKADELNPDDPSIRGSMAYCQFALTKHSSQDAHVALDVLETLVQDNPQIARLHHYIGMVLVRSDGSKSQAAEAFAKAFNLDQRLVEAQRQLHALKVKQRQKVKEKKKKKGFGGIFGR